MSTAVISPAAAGLRVLTDPALRGAHHDLTGPVPLSWPEALELLPAEPGEPVTFRVAAGRQFPGRLTGAGIPAGTAELLITRAGDPGRRERLHDRHLRPDHRPPPAPGHRVPPPVPRGIHLMPRVTPTRSRPAASSPAPAPTSHPSCNPRIRDV
jgi:hypothetical protein